MEPPEGVAGDSTVSFSGAGGAGGVAGAGSAKAGAATPHADASISALTDAHSNLLDRTICPAPDRFSVVLKEAYKEDILEQSREMVKRCYLHLAGAGWKARHSESCSAPVSRW